MAFKKSLCLRVKIFLSLRVFGEKDFRKSAAFGQTLSQKALSIFWLKVFYFQWWTFQGLFFNRLQGLEPLIFRALLLQIQEPRLLLCARALAHSTVEGLTKWRARNKTETKLFKFVDFFHIFCFCERLKLRTLKAENSWSWERLKLRTLKAENARSWELLKLRALKAKNARSWECVP